LKTIKTSWEQFETVIRKDIPAPVKAALKLAFYSGAEAMFLGFAEGTENADFGEMKAWIKAVKVEIADFSKHAEQWLRNEL
jgi:hypothetical protein